MKKIILILTVMVFGLSTAFAQDQNTQNTQNAQQNTDKPVKPVNPNAPVASFDKTTADLGDIIQGNPTAAVFTLTNTGKEPLMISSATASCGCTNLTWSKEPILPGKSTTISATYNAAAQGNFTKSITVRTNADEQPVILMIKGRVLPKS